MYVHPNLFCVVCMTESSGGRAACCGQVEALLASVEEEGEAGGRGGQGEGSERPQLPGQPHRHLLTDPHLHTRERCGIFITPNPCLVHE